MTFPMLTKKSVTLLVLAAVWSATGGCSQQSAGLVSSLTHGPPAVSRASASGLAIVYAFKGTPDGYAPTGDLLAVDGNLYGTTAAGGVNNLGSVFKLTLAGEEQILFSFQASGTSNSPSSGLIRVSGEFYGTTNYAEYGLDEAGTERVLHTLTGGAGGDVEQGPLVFLKGLLYGATQLGGKNGCNSGCGLVYSVTPSGSQHIVHSFGGRGDGFLPQGGLIAVKGSLYGTTAYGGKNNAGTVYELSPGGSKRVLYSFTGGDDGSYPTGKLLALKGALYGATRYNGRYGYGAIFAVALSGRHSVLYGFTGGADGGSPNGSLVSISGVLYGTTANGGRGGKGTVFSLTRSGTEHALASFDGSNGNTPLEGLVHVNGALYGTTLRGGPADDGTVFRISP